ncbi:Hsp70 family protein [Lachnospiraceae bacterium 62-35]
MCKIIGIDLGRTKCCVSVMEGGRPVLIPDRGGSHMTPSAVAWKRNGKKLIGEAAKRQAEDNLAGTFFAIKENIETGRSVNIRGESYSPQELTAMIFQKLKQDAESYLGSRVDEAVLTIPSYFNEIQRQAIRDAGRIAGLKINRFITGPSAAALSYYLKKKKDQKLLVCDMGSSGFDVSVIEIGDGVVEILSSGGDKRLGGNALDEMLVYRMLSDFREKEGVDLAADSTALYRLREEAEQAKKILTAFCWQEAAPGFLPCAGKSSS